MRTMDSAQEFFFVDGAGSQCGPVTAATLKEYWAGGYVNDTTYAFAVDGSTANWTPISQLPWALAALLIGFAMTAYFPHPESPGDAPICLTIVFLAEFLSSVLYSPKRPRGILKFLKLNDIVPLVLNNFKLGTLYGLFCDAFKVGS